jgi:hypothetical protein
VICLAKNKNALVLEMIEIRSAQFGHEMILAGNDYKLATDEHRFTQIHVKALGVSFS